MKVRIARTVWSQLEEPFRDGHCVGMPGGATFMGTIALALSARFSARERIRYPEAEINIG